MAWATDLVGTSEIDAEGRSVTYWMDRHRLRAAKACPTGDLGRDSRTIRNAFAGRPPLSLDACFLDEAATACWHHIEGICFYDPTRKSWLFLGHRWALCRADGGQLNDIRPLSPVRRRLAEVQAEVARATDAWLARAARAEL